ncbi:MAG TPA: class I SAM-dependent methyltransferase [Spirochaetes bacterium]|nr:class I SAM-dependent methyltransferase [Spirochaetota bacterium]
MNPYTAFAPFYDSILSHVDYDQWYRYIRALLFRYIDSPRYIIELGCGTGRFGAKFSRDDIPVIGMDKSLDMLRVAKARAYRNFSIFCGDMTGFRLSKKFDFIFSVHDTVNYITETRELRKVFHCVWEALAENGVFMFDITTDYNIRLYFDGKSTRYNLRGTEVEWHNYYEKKKRLIHSTLVFTLKDGSVQTERHVQRIYSVTDIKALLKKEGFRVVDILGDYTMLPPGKKSVMINFIARKA